MVGQPVRSSADLPDCEPFSRWLVALPASGGSDAAGEPQNDDGTSGSIVPVASIQDAEVHTVSALALSAMLSTACA